MSAHKVAFDLAKVGEYYALPDPGSGGTVEPVDRSPCYLGIRTAGAEARTIPRPNMRGLILHVVMEKDGGDATVTVTGNYSEAGDSVFTLSDPDQFFTFVSTYASAADAYSWRKVSDYTTGNLNGLTASAADLNALDVQTLGTPAPAGFTGGVGTIYQQTRIKTNGLFKTTILFDLTGLGSSTTDLDVIGQGAAAAHIGKLTALETGAVIDAILVTCLEAPATGVTDMDLYSAVEGTAKFDDAVTGLTETALLTAGAAWTNGLQKAATVCPTAEEYLYWVNGAAGTVGTYTAGKFLIEIYGH